MASRNSDVRAVAGQLPSPLERVHCRGRGLLGVASTDGDPILHDLCSDSCLCRALSLKQHVINLRDDIGRIVGSGRNRQYFHGASLALVADIGVGVLFAIPHAQSHHGRDIQSRLYDDRKIDCP